MKGDSTIFSKMNSEIISSGAEAIITKEKNFVIKQRIKKGYRIPELDDKIRKLRTRSESKILKKAGLIVNIPKVIETDEREKTISMEFIDGLKLSTYLDSFPLKKQKEVCYQIGETTAKIHKENIIHSDLTTSNMILKDDKVFFIDFGLGFCNGKYEDKAVDLHLLKQALEAKHFRNWEELYFQVEKGYLSIEPKEAKKVIERLKAVEKRGRYKH